MRTTLSAMQIEDYRETGFIVIEDFLDQSELGRWQRDTQEAVDQRLAAVTPGNAWDHLTNQGTPDDYYSQVFTQCLRLIDTHSGMRELLLNPALGKMMCELAGIEGIRIYHDQALFKPPLGNPTGWHLDNPYWAFSSHDSLSIWVALDDATLSNGCLHYVPGSHRTARYENSGIGQNMSDLFKLYPDWRKIETVATPCKAGSAVVHNGLVAHGAGANMTNKPRRAMTCAYMPDGSTYNGTPSILGAEYIASLNVGDVLDNDVEFPKVWPV